MQHSAEGFLTVQRKKMGSLGEVCRGRYASNAAPTRPYSEFTKLFLIADAPLTEPEETSLAKPPFHAIKRLREEYKRLMLENLRAPDGSYEDGLSIPEIGQLPRRADNFAANLQKNNPLSLDEDVCNLFS